MALFSKKTKQAQAVGKKAPVAAPTSAVSVAPQGSGMRTSLAHVLKHARITEKATMHQSGGVYVFDIADKASKRDVMLAVKSLYNVTPRKVAVVNVPTKTKRNMRTGREGMKRGGKKAYVYLKSGETITF